jgi:hypothetical protein
VGGLRSAASRGTLDNTVPTKRSAIAFALGAAIGVRTTSAPSMRKISSNAAVNLAS